MIVSVFDYLPLFVIIWMPASVIVFHAAQLIKGQRLFTNSVSASMGYD